MTQLNLILISLAVESNFMLVNVLQLQAAVCSTGLAASEKTYPVLKWEILLRKVSWLVHVLKEVS